MKSGDEEKVCLTAGQIENIGKAYAKNFPVSRDVCPKADAWVRGFFGKKRKQKKREKEPEEIIVDGMISRAMRKLNAKLDELF